MLTIGCNSNKRQKLGKDYRNQNCHQLPNWWLMKKKKNSMNYDATIYKPKKLILCKIKLYPYAWSCYRFFRVREIGAS